MWFLDAIRSVLGTLTLLFNAIFSRLMAWGIDRHQQPPCIIAKRRELVDTIPRNARVLEIGAGTGATLATGAYDGPAGRFASLTFAEPDVGMRGRLQAKLQDSSIGVATGAVVVDAALPRLPFEDAYFDSVVLFFVASHLPDRKAGIAEIARVLRPGGTLLFMDHGAHPEEHGHSHGHGHGHGNSAVHEHEDAHDRVNSHASNNERPAATPFFYEWLKYMNYRRKKEFLSVDIVLKEAREEERLQEMFENRMQVDYFYKECTYACFKRKSDTET